jgi:drug/metabolite transporter (DMT)-like permease
VADLALVFVMAVWGSSFAVLRFFLSGAGGDASQAASPLLVLAARMAVASVLLVAFLAARPSGRADLRALFAPGALGPGGVLRDGLVCGALLAVAFLLQTEGLPRTTASRSGFLTGLLVAFVPLLELALYRKRPSPPALLALGLSMAGMALLSGAVSLSAAQGGAMAGGIAPIGSTLAGDVLTTLCALVFAGHILVLGRVTGRHPIAVLVLVQLLCVGLAAALVGPLVEVGRLPAAPRLWLAIVYLAVFCTLVAYGVQTWAQRVVAPVRMALLNSLEPVFAALWAGVFLGERLSTAERLGGGLIVLAVVVGEAGAALWARRAAGNG